MRQVRDHLHVSGGMLFEWDSAKAALNLTSHGVNFEEAATVFGDLYARMYGDPDHSEDESRFLLVGTSAGRRLLVMAALDRGERIRLITARPVTRRERQEYEEDRS